MKQDRVLKKEYLLPGGVILAILVISLTLLRSSISGIFTLRDENVQKEEKLGRLETKSGALLALDDQDLTSRVEAVERIFPSKKPVLNLIASVSSLSTDEGVSFQGIELQPGLISGEAPVAAEAEGKEEFSISFSVIGDLDKVFSFMGNLEKTTPVMKVDSFAIDLVSGETVEVTFDVTVYFQKPPETIGKVDFPLPVLTDMDPVFAQLEEFKIVKEIKPVAETGKQNPFK